ncbi:hypothetical protein [Streptomyces fuscichromogenes]|uniref:Uncharacterized protein n=1 Tax=Streptomyces fuscichromogenes TaxID=1324013 RepID=A0A917X7U1_9ACTN|nr:hypothetical protein [Streptomyces fuscichromogenes]GGM91989.1 hypothetical protein GCM10011578_009930 [Streptomyces fuscichromogenes]
MTLRLEYDLVLAPSSHVDQIVATVRTGLLAHRTDSQAEIDMTYRTSTTQDDLRLSLSVELELGHFGMAERGSAGLAALLAGTSFRDPAIRTVRLSAFRYVGDDTFFPGPARGTGLLDASARPAPCTDWRPAPADRTSDLEGLAGLRATAFPVTHAGTEALGYRVLGTLFSGDAVCDDRLASAVDDSVRTFVVDCGGGRSGNAGHAGAADIAELVRKRDSLRSVLLTHIGTPASEDDALLSAFQGCGSEVRILSDGDRFELV